MIRCAVAPKLRNIFAIMFENILVLRTSQQSLVKGAQDFSQPVAVLYCALVPLNQFSRPQIPELLKHKVRRLALYNDKLF